MPSEPTQPFAVIQTRFERIDPECLRDVLFRDGGLARADASRVANRHRGIIGEKFTHGQATLIVQQLLGQGYQVCAVPSDSLPVLERPRVVRWCEMSDEALVIPEGIRGQTLAVAWPSIFVVNIGLINDARPSAAAEYSPGYGSIREPDDTTEYLAPVYSNRSHYLQVVDLIAIDSGGRLVYIRLPSRKLEYHRILGNCAKMQLFERFQKVVAMLVERSTEAIVAPATRKLIVQRGDDSLKITCEHGQFAEERELHHHDRWLLTLAIRSERQDPEPL